MVLYGIAGPLAALLVALPVLTEAEPDIGTLVGGARVLAQVGAHEQAISGCEAVLSRDGNNVPAHLLLALLRDRRGETEAAVASYQAVLGRELDEEQDRAVRLAIADVHLRHGDPGRALPWIDEVLGLDFSSVDAHLLRGMALSELERYDEARGSLEQAERLAPGDERVARAIDEMDGRCVLLVP